ncbi:NADPH quinone reductase related Zn-dependent oxidoreductase [Lactobacillus selangorensis]|uniref:NADPH quinone reductase related Zn-dependent oxidoreductase n=1 Tax=Lactobacillus selangorensis TaxID=81857 RepID=A0A0R2FVC7_9LACO|nr:zinc-binding alcohol dehydrogenase family protein [Lactobacillus selangorensis]KRN28829.1 NADPH quinone reductase related Zn-dependent oxidoreductase [Lactobacillus selangorensis]KRN32761.1 NADPH quinone reductase related Zn-dependent oxidoreductase [Lactobacillus selangorensis]
MKAVVVSQPGGPEVLHYTDVPTPQVKPGWSLVQVKGFGINHSEIFTREGKSPSVHFPRILGIEAVGIISQTTAPDKLPVGQQVMSLMGEMGRAYDGSYAEYVLLPNDQIYPIRSSLSWAELATIPETFYTAYGALLGLNLQDSQHLLIQGGTSGVGVTAVKLARAMNHDLTITGTTRSNQKTAALKDHGYDAVILDSDNHLQTSAQFDRILDLIGPAAVPDSLQHLNLGGIVSSTGELGGVWDLDHFDPITKIPNGRYLTSFYSGDVAQNVLNDLLQLIETKHIDVAPEKVFSLEHVQQAHEYLASSRSIGKVVVTL